MYILLNFTLILLVKSISTYERNLISCIITDDKNREENLRNYLEMCRPLNTFNVYLTSFKRSIFEKQLNQEIVIECENIITEMIKLYEKYKSVWEDEVKIINGCKSNMKDDLNKFNQKMEFIIETYGVQMNKLEDIFTKNFQFLRENAICVNESFINTSNNVRL
ncbi:putative SP-containing protein [Vairimorpha necatrix]|uniref:SP-containing protein n=1 Tax=Vairimorpha necatrix TaxID=6039 RepID=A0AAX4J9D0_9MICR